VETLVLYSYYRSSCAYRVRIALYYKNLDFDYKTVHLVKAGGEQFQKEFLKYSPFAQVPCLKHKNQVLSQSLPILLYLEDLKPTPSLLPKDSFKRAEVLSFCEMINSGIQPLQNLSVLKHVEETTGYDKLKWAKYWIEKRLLQCEEFLKPRSKKFCFGEKLSLADLFLIPQIYNAKRFKIDENQIPTLEKINQHCLKMTAFQKALPENQPDAPKIHNFT